MSQFNQRNKKRMNFVWITKYKILLELCIVKHVALKKVFTFQTTKPLVLTTVKSAKAAARI